MSLKEKRKVKNFELRGELLLKLENLSKKLKITETDIIRLSLNSYLNRDEFKEVSVGDNNGI